MDSLLCAYRVPHAETPHFVDILCEDTGNVLELWQMIQEVC